MFTLPMSKTVKYTLLICGIALSVIIYFFYSTNKLLNKDEKKTQSVDVNTVGEVTYSGIINFIDKRNFKNEDISYYLSDSSGKYIVYLKASDQKLSVLEGLFVEVSGNIDTGSKESIPVIVVTKVFIKK